MAASRAGAPQGAASDAIDMLKSDHREVETLFDKYESGKETMPPDEKQQIAEKICLALTAHATIEEEIFYPAVREKCEEELDGNLDEAEVEHDSLKYLIEQIEEAEEVDSSYDAKVKVLSEYVKHHVKEEEGQMFPQVRKASDIDFLALGAKMAERKAEVVSEGSSET